MGLKTNLMIATTVALFCTASTVAYATDWRTVDRTPAGVIMEVDVDSVVHQRNGVTRAYSSLGGEEGTLFFDCNGHYTNGSDGPVQHIPQGSLIASAQKTVCGQ